jgi:hypothetical protein
MAKMVMATVVLAGVCLVGCAGGGEDGDIPGGPTESCDPFQPIYEPTTLADNAVAGQDSDGTTYVVDRLEREGAFTVERLFISSGNLLQRIEPTGASCPGLYNPGDVCTIEWQVGVEKSSVWIEKEGNGQLIFWLCDDGLGVVVMGSCEDLCIPIPVLNKGALAEFQVKNLPGTRVLEHLAATDLGAYVAVIAPEYDWTDEQYRVFVGPPEAMKEVPLIEIHRFLCPVRNYVVEYQGQEAIIHIDYACPDPGCGSGSDESEPQGCYVQMGDVVDELTLIVNGEFEADPHWGGSDKYDASEFEFLCL